jgi:hypothetical protein
LVVLRFDVNDFTFNEDSLMNWLLFNTICFRGHGSIMRFTGVSHALDLEDGSCGQSEVETLLAVLRLEHMHTSDLAQRRERTMKPRQTSGYAWEGARALTLSTGYAEGHISSDLQLV